MSPKYCGCMAHVSLCCKRVPQEQRCLLLRFINSNNLVSRCLLRLSHSMQIVGCLYVLLGFRARSRWPITASHPATHLYFCKSWWEKPWSLHSKQTVCGFDTAGALDLVTSNVTLHTRHVTCLLPSVHSSQTQCLFFPAKKSETLCCGKQHWSNHEAHLSHLII